MTPLRSSNFLLCPTYCARPVSLHQFGVAHQTSLRPLLDHDDLFELPRGSGGGRVAYSALRSLQGRTIYRTRHSRTGSTAFLPQLSAAAEFLVVNLVAQHDPQTDSEFASGSHSRFPQSFLYQFAPIEAF